MKRFPALEEYSNDDLIIIITDDKENWQKEAVEFASYLLSERGVTEDFIHKRIIEIRNEAEILWQNELEERKNESYKIYEMVLMYLFLYKYIFRDWNLNREGYTRKRKQRLIIIGSGILTIALVILAANLSFDSREKEKMDRIINLANLDSIAQSKIDWTGEYIFIDTSIESGEKVIWELQLHKVRGEHHGTLKLTKDHYATLISCTGLIRNNELEIYPDTTNKLFNGQEIDYYNRLFKFLRDSDTIYTSWDKMAPFYYPRYNGNGLFRKSNIESTVNDSIISKDEDGSVSDKIVDTLISKKCDYNTLLAVRNNLENLNKSHIRDLLFAIDTLCVNDVEFGEFGNELLFMVLGKEPELVIFEFQENISKIDTGYIFLELGRPINDGIDIKQILVKVENTNIENATKQRIIEILRKVE